MTPTRLDRPPRLLVASSFHRSGSTLLQRYVTAMTGTFVWGESRGLIEALRAAYDAWPAGRKSAREYQRLMADPTYMEREFIPNVCPPRERVVDALRRAVVDVYDEIPAGFTDWGWKGVVYGRPEIEFVRMLFPDIRVILLVRHPVDVARSARRKGWIDRRGYFDDMHDLVAQWVERTSYFAELRNVDDPKLFFVRYEDLAERLDALDAFIGATPDPERRRAVMERKLGTAPTVSRFDFTAEDEAVVTALGGRLIAELGYAG